MTKRFPATERWVSLCERAERDIKLARQLGPFVAEMSRRSDGTRFPAGVEGGGHAEGVHSDPTFSAIESRLHCGEESEWTPAHRSTSAEPSEGAPRIVDTPGGRFAKLVEKSYDGGPYEEEHGKRALLRLLDLFAMLSGAVNELVDQAPAAATAIRNGLSPTNGRGQTEIAAEKAHRRAAHDEACVLCEVPVRKSGLCNTHYMQFYRSDHYQAGAGDPREWIARKRSEQIVTSTEWDHDRHQSLGPAYQERRAA
jgi:hypothetical protein